MLRVLSESREAGRVARMTLFLRTGGYGFMHYGREAELTARLKSMLKRVKSDVKIDHCRVYR